MQRGGVLAGPALAGVVVVGGIAATAGGIAAHAVHAGSGRMPTGIQPGLQPVISRRAFLLAAAAGAACSRPPANSTPLRRATEFLWAQQAEDGGFHSKTYGLLKAGQALTPFVLDALLDGPAPPTAGSARE